MANKSKVAVEITAVDKTKAAFKSVTGSLNSLKGVYASLAGAAGIGGLFAITKEVSGAADEINKLSDQLGVSTEALSEYQFVAQQTGVEFRTFTTGLQRMVRRVSEAANGTGVAVNALNELGVSAKKLNQLEPDQQFEVLADALQGVKSESDKVRIAFQLFDSDGVKLLRTMKGGSEGIRELRGEAEQMGLTISQDAADAFTEFEDSLGRLRSVMKASAQETATIFLPAFKAVVDFLAVNLPKATKIATRELNRSRQAVLEAASGIFSLFGADEQAAIATRAANKFKDDVAEINSELSNMTVELGTAVNAEGLFDDSLKNINSTLANQKVALKERNKALAEARAIFEATRTPAEKLVATQEKLNALLSKGFITDDTAKRALQDATEAYQQADVATQAFQKSMADGQAVYDSTRTKLEAFSAEVARLKTLYDEGAISDDTFNRAITSAAESTKNLTKEADKAENAWKDLGLTFASAFEDAVVEGGKASDILKGLEKDILRILSRKLVTEPLAGAASNFLGGLFTRALGGPVTAGTPYLVGEQGPELFVPNAGGKIAQASPSVNISINNSAPSGNYQSDMQLAAKVGQAVNRALRRNR